MKNLILFFINIFFFLKVNSQAPDWVWASSPATGGGIGFTREEGIATDNSSNLYVAGAYQRGYITFGSDTLTCPLVLSEPFLAKYSPNGNVIWAKSDIGITINSYSGAYNVATDVYGNVYLTGTFEDTVAFGSDTLICHHYGDDIFFVKYDSSGNVIWTRTAGGPDQNYAYSMATDASGNLYVTGHTQATTFTIGSFTFTNPTGEYIFIAKYDSSGAVQWAKVNGGATVNGGEAVATDGLGNVCLSGEFSAPYLVFGNDTIYRTGSIDYFLAKFDSTGNTLWAKNIGISNEGVSYLVTDAINNVYVICQDTNETYFIKYNSSGNLIWDRTYPFPYISANGLATDKHDKIYFAGSFNMDTIRIDTVTLIRYPGSPATYIVEFDTSGKAIWGTVIAGGSSYPLSVAVASTECVYAAGGFVNAFSLDTIVLIPSSTQENVFVGKLCSDIALNISETKKDNGVVVYPNPFENNLTFATKIDGEFELTLFDITSRELLRRSFVNSATINTEQLAGGIYFYEVGGKDGVGARGKLVKE